MAEDEHGRTSDQSPTIRTRKPFISLLTADGISQTGNMLSMLAVPWFVLETTWSSARTGLTAAIAAVVTIVASILGGALVPMPGLWIIVAANAIEALFLEPVNLIWMTIVQERVPEEIRGRVFGSMMAFSSGARSLGLVSYGFLLEGFGLKDTRINLAVINLSLPLIFALIPALKDQLEYVTGAKANVTHART